MVTAAFFALVNQALSKSLELRGFPGRLHLATIAQYGYRHFPLLRRTERLPRARTAQAGIHRALCAGGDDQAHDRGAGRAANRGGTDPGQRRVGRLQPATRGRRPGGGLSPLRGNERDATAASARAPVTESTFR